MRRAASIALVALGLAIPASASGDTPPPGATARCNDGTYSYSQTHSGTCSHHGGVAQWLTPTTAPPATPPVTPSGGDSSCRTRDTRGAGNADRRKHRRRQHDPARAANEDSSLQARREP